MNQVAIVVVADTESHGDLGRIVNALEFAKELTEHGDEAALIFDGAGTKWIGELADPDHDAHPLYEAVKSEIVGACAYCSAAFGAKNAVEEEGVELLDEYDRHPSLRRWIDEGYQIVTF